MEYSVSLLRLRLNITIEKQCFLSPLLTLETLMSAPLSSRALLKARSTEATALSDELGGITGFCRMETGTGTPNNNPASPDASRFRCPVIIGHVGKCRLRFCSRRKRTLKRQEREDVSLSWRDLDD
jgi:hypothetical protein